MAKQQNILEDTNIDNLSEATSFSHMLLWISVAFILFLVLWAHFAVLDEVTNAQGKVIPSKQTQVVQNLEGGIVQEILVREGDTVQAGEPIMIIDDTQFSSAHDGNLQQVQDLEAKAARLSALASEKPFTLPDGLKNARPSLFAHEKSLYQTALNHYKKEIAMIERQIQQINHRKEELKSQQKHLQKSHSLVMREIALTRPLVREGAASEVELLRLERQASDLQNQLESANHGIPRTQSQLDELSAKMSAYKASFYSENLDKLSETNSELHRLRQQSVSLKDRVERTTVRSPVKGIVSQIFINTVGGVIKPGESLMNITPVDDSLLIQAYVRPDDIGFLRPGLPATVKIAAFDFSIYGGLDGEVEHISSDTVAMETGESYYEILVRTNQTHFGSASHAIIPGMPATVDILTGEKSVLDYLLKPVLKAKHEAMREK